MLEFLLDASNIQPEYTFYVGILFGLTVKFFWVWNIEYIFIDSIKATSEVHIQAKNLSLQMKRQMYSHTRLTWIMKFIRRKENPGDEPEPFISSILV